MSAISLTDFTVEIQTDQTLQSVIEGKIKQLVTRVDGEEFVSVSDMVKSIVEAGEEKGYQFRLSEIEKLKDHMSEQHQLFKAEDFRNSSLPL